MIKKETKKILQNFLLEKKEYNDVSKLEETYPSLLSTKNIAEFVNENSEHKQHQL